jgi:tetratricopeptide (TPR) repeat protein
VLRLSPGNAIAYYNLGVISLELKSEREAVKYFQTAIALDPGLKLGHFQLANLSMRSRLYQDAFLHYARASQLGMDNEFVRLMKAMALVRLERYSEAKAELEEGVAALPESADLATALARLLSASPVKSIQDGPRALGLAEKCMQAQKSPDFELVETYGMALAATGRFKEAAELQQKMIAELESANRKDLATVLKANLELYEHRQASLIPWREDDPIFDPQPGKMMLSITNNDVSLGK